MPKIECLFCYEPIDIPKYIDLEEYEGEIVCKNCHTRASIKFANSPKPTKYKVVKEGAPREIKVITAIERPEKGK